MPAARESCDVAVIGGGPGGSTAALCLARRGRRVVVVEKERFPRFHIGESLLPWNLELFDELGIHDDIKAAGFVRKLGAGFVSACGEHRRRFYFRNTYDQGPPCAYQVLRSKFDHLLLERARREGAQVREESTVREARDTGSGWELDVAPAGGEPYALSARVLVDASGQQTFLASRLRLKRIDPAHRRFAVFGHFHGVERDPGDDAGNILIVPFGEGHWFWFIPLADDLTSIGAVVTKETVQAHRADLQGYLLERIAATPELRRRSAGARLAWPVHTLSDFSYDCDRYAGDRFVLVGDAAAFLDPVFSSGVYMAMSSARLAAEAVDRGLDTGELGRRAFRGYERRHRREIAAYFRLIRAYYTPSVLEMFMNPTQRLRLQGAVTTLLAGRVEPSFAVRWRLELFYLLGKLLGLRAANRRHLAACSHGCSVHTAAS